MPVLKTSDKNLSKHLSRFRAGTSRIHKKKVKPRKSVLRWLEGQQENVVFLLESGHSCPPNLPLFQFLGCLISATHAQLSEILRENTKE